MKKELLFIMLMENKNSLLKRLEWREDCDDI